MRPSQRCVRLSAAALVMAGMHGAIAVAIGAYAAHGMARGFTAEAIARVETASVFQLVHAAALVGAAAVVFARLSPRAGRAMLLAVLAHGLGALLFSGSLYGATFATWGSFGATAPIGGTLLICGWLALSVAGAFALLDTRQGQANDGRL